MPCRAHMLKMPNNVCLIDFYDGQRLFGSINANNNGAVESRVYLSGASLYIIHKLIKLLVTRSPNSFTRCQTKYQEKNEHIEMTTMMAMFTTQRFWLELMLPLFDRFSMDAFTELH